MDIFTIGYEGTDIDGFVEGLKREGVELVADLRKNPVSRKPGFSKKRLGENLAKKKIEYRHFPNLGVPSEWRKKAKARLITRRRMFGDYEKKILPRAKEDLEQLRQLLRSHKTVLLCYETDASDCHRSYVAKALVALEKKRLRVVNLIPFSSRPLLKSLLHP